MRKIHLGFEVGTGEPVEIPLMHMVVTGQTQQAGKTTTMEALIDRARLPALAFVTKRGEQSFTDGRRIPPYFRERADWQFVASVLEASLNEKLKFERAWIMKASKGAKTLADVQTKVAKLMEDARPGMSQDVYLTLFNYLEIVVPRVAAIDWAKTIDIKPGINVMDLADRERFPVELQGLVMRSALEWVYERSDGVITIIPEAWEFLPQGRGSPVKLSAESLMRKGAGLQNFVWLDSQDIGGVSKDMLRHCTVWLIGVQRESNEIKRTLDNIPAGVKRPKPTDVATLKKGQFFACYGDHVFKTYVQPKWMGAAAAKDIALGATSIDELLAKGVTSRAQIEQENALVTEADVRQARETAYEEGFAKGYAAATSTLAGQIEGVIRTANAFMDELRAVGKQLAHSPPGAPKAGDSYFVKAGALPAQFEMPPGKVVRLRPPKTKAKIAHGSPHETAGRKLLFALSCFERLRWPEACIVAVMVPENGYFYGGKKWLLDNHLVIEEDSQVHLTAPGRSMRRTLTDAEGPPTLAQLIDLWRPKLKPPGPDMLDALARDPEKLFSTEGLARLINRKPGNGYWYGGVKALRRNNLVIETSGGLQLSPFMAKLARGESC